MEWPRLGVGSPALGSGCPGVRRPCLTRLLQGRVVQFSTNIERCLQFVSLLAIRIQTILERSS
jgi:hypothetical protein